MKPTINQTTKEKFKEMTEAKKASKGLGIRERYWGRWRGRNNTEYFGYEYKELVFYCLKCQFTIGEFVENKCACGTWIKKDKGYEKTI